MASTLRLSDEQEKLLMDVMSDLEVKTKSKAIGLMIEDYWANRAKICEQLERISELEGMINGMSNAREAFKAILNELDQEKLF